MTKKTVLIPVLAVITAAAAAYGWRRRAAAGPGEAATPVAVVQGTIEATIEASGAVTPLNRIAVKPPIAGRVDRLMVEEGARVDEGQILAWMSSSDRAAILDAARANSPAELKRWEEAYKPTPIISPLKGVVILRNVVQGETVDAGTTLYAVSDRLIVTAQVDEADIGRVTKGMPARIELDAYPGRRAAGKVFDILFEGKNVSNVITYGVKIEIEKVPDFFRSQMTASVSFIAGHKDDALLIPVAAVRESARHGGKRVMVPGPDAKPESREIETGIESGDLVEVVSGLRAGDSVLLGLKRYKPQRGPDSSPLMMGGGRRPGSGGQGGGSGGSGREGGRGGP